MKLCYPLTLHTKITLEYLGYTEHHKRIVVGYELDRIFHVNRSPFDIAAIAEARIATFFKSMSRDHANDMRRALDQRSMGSYRRAMGEWIDRARATLSDRSHPEALFVGPGSLEQPAIEKCAPQFSCRLLDVDLTAARDNHRRTDNCRLIRAEFSNGLYKALHLLPFLIDREQVVDGPKKAKPLRLRWKDLHKFFSHLVKICNSYSTTPDDEEVALFGGAANLAVSINVASEVALHAIQMLTEQQHLLAGSKEAFVQAVTQSALESKPIEQCLAGRLEHEVMPAMRDLSRKIRLRHVATLVKSLQERGGTLLFSDSFSRFLHPLGDPSRVVEEQENYSSKYSPRTHWTDRETPEGKTCR